MFTPICNPSNNSKAEKAMGNVCAGRVVGWAAGAKEAEATLT